MIDEFSKTVNKTKEDIIGNRSPVSSKTRPLNENIDNRNFDELNL